MVSVRGGGRSEFINKPRHMCCNCNNAKYQLRSRKYTCKHPELVRSITVDPFILRSTNGCPGGSSKLARAKYAVRLDQAARLIYDRALFAWSTGANWNKLKGIEKLQWLDLARQVMELK